MISKTQKIIALLVIIVVIVAVVVFALLRQTKENKDNLPSAVDKSKVETPVDNITVTPTGKNYNEIAKNLAGKVKQDTASAKDLYDLGVAYYNLDKPDDAIDAYTKSLAEDPNNAVIYGNLGNIYRDKGDASNAEQNYKKAINLNPSDYRFYAGLAFVYNNLMDNKYSAIEVINQGLLAIPDNQEMKNILAEYNK